LEAVERVENAGRKGTLKKPLELGDIVEKYKKLTNLSHVRLALPENKTFRKFYFIFFSGLLHGFSRLFGLP